MRSLSHELPNTLTASSVLIINFSVRTGRTSPFGQQHKQKDRLAAVSPKSNQVPTVFNTVLLATFNRNLPRSTVF